MKTKLHELDELLAGLEALGQERDRKVGARDELKRRLKEEFGCENEERAVAALNKLKKELEKVEGEVDELYAELKAKYGKRLAGGE